jgi:hypothetical protein
VLERDGQQLSATQTWRDALADADHLAILNAIWTDQTTPACEQRYKDLLMAALPPGYRQEPGHQAKWLWRTLRAAELAGLDPEQLLCRSNNRLSGWPVPSPAARAPWWLAGCVLLKIVYLLVRRAGTAAPASALDRNLPCHARDAAGLASQAGRGQVRHEQ